MTFLWTDICLLLVLFVAMIFILAGFRKENTRRIYQRIFKKMFAVISGIILVFFIVVGVLDSIHINFKGSSITLLDKALAPLNTVYEKTYSAPLAIHLYSAEIEMQKNVLG